MNSSAHICRHCSAPFEPNHHLQKFCTPDCRRDHGTPSPKLTTCRSCGEKFAGLANQRYCKNPCISPTAAAKRPEAVPCARCGEEFIRSTASQRYCSPGCKKPKPSKPCRGCGKPFTPVAGQAYCGSPCISPTARLHAPKPPLEPKPCVRCGKDFQPLTRHHKYCSPDCKAAKHQPPKWQLNPNVEYKLDTWRKHVLEIAGHECADCHATSGLEVHHILPRARGGKNVVRNGMVLCRPCHELRHDPSMATDDLVERIAHRVVEIIGNRS